MTGFRATALVLTGAALLAVGTAAEGRGSFGAQWGGAGRAGSAMGLGGVGFGAVGFGHGRFGKGHFGRGRFGHRDFRDGGFAFRHRHFNRHHRFRRFDRFWGDGRFGRSERFGRRFDDFGLFWPDGFGLGYGYGVGLNRDSDFFLPWSGPRAAVGNGRAVYDYDRGYPYEHFRYEDVGGPSDDTARAPRCTTEWGWDSSQRRDVPIRVCRQ